MKIHTLFFGLLILLSSAFAQTDAVYKQVQETKNNTVHFISDQLVPDHARYTGDGASQDLSERAISFFPDKSALESILRNTSGYMELVLPDLDGNTMRLELVRSDIFTPDFLITVDDEISEDILLYDLSGSGHYRGIVSGDPNSLVSISFFEDAIYGIIHSAGLGELNLGRVPGQNSFEHVLYDAKSLGASAPFNCYTPDDDARYTSDQLDPATFRAAGDVVEIFIEVDGDLTSALGGSVQAANWMTALFNESATLYANESVNMAISEMKINTSVQYRGNSSSRFLSKFQDTYSGGFNGDLAHLVNAKSSAGGVAAGFSGICNSNVRESMCYSGLQTSFNSVPTYSWSVMVFTHEMGHLLGSRHTHACVWNGNNTAIDGCAGQTEGTCALPGNPSNGGTIMSYCHLTSAGIDFTQGFGPQPGNVIRNTLANATCLSGGAAATCSDGIQNQGEDGVDCGGPCPDACAAATCSDGIQNQGETGVDCGGPCAPCPPSACDDPANLSVTRMARQGGKKATLGWSAVSGAASYDVRLRSVGSSAWTEVNTAGTSVNFRGFTDFVTYEWEVRANCSGSSSNYVGCTFTWVDGGSDNCGAGNLAFGSAGYELLAYPNPASDVLTVKLKSSLSSTYSLELFNVMGESVIKHIVSGPEPVDHMDIRSINPGIYFLIADDGSDMALQKIIISR